jgi:hypothetical protein
MDRFRAFIHHHIKAYGFSSHESGKTLSSLFSQAMEQGCVADIYDGLQDLMRPLSSRTYDKDDDHPIDHRPLCHALTQAWRHVHDTTPYTPSDDGRSYHAWRQWYLGTASSDICDQVVNGDLPFCPSPHPHTILRMSHRQVDQWIDAASTDRHMLSWPLVTDAWTRSWGGGSASPFVQLVNAHGSKAYAAIGQSEWISDLAHGCTRSIHDAIGYHVRYHDMKTSDILAWCERILPSERDLDVLDIMGMDKKKPWIMAMAKRPRIVIACGFCCS